MPAGTVPAGRPPQRSAEEIAAVAQQVAQKNGLNPQETQQLMIGLGLGGGGGSIGANPAQALGAAVGAPSASPFGGLNPGQQATQQSLERPSFDPLPPTPDQAELLRQSLAVGGSLAASFALTPLVPAAAAGIGALGVGTKAIQLASAIPRIGGIAGAVGGSLLGSEIERAAFNARDVPLPDDFNPARTAIIEGLMEVGGLALAEKGIPFARRVFASQKVAPFEFLSQVRNKGVQELAAAANRFGIDIGIQEASSSFIARKFQKLLGLMPIINRPIQQAASRRGAQIVGSATGDASTDLFGALAPLSAFDDISRGVFTRAKKAFKETRAIVDESYRAAKDLAKSQGAIVPPDEISKAAIAFEKRLKDEAPKFLGKKGRARAFDSDVPEKVKQFIADSRKLLPMNIDQYVGWSSRLNQRIADMVNASNNGKLGKQGKFILSLLADMKQAGEKSLGDISGKGVAEAFEGAAKQASDLFSVFDTATARQFGKVDRNVFQAGFSQAGTKESDVILRDILKLDSAEAVRSMRELMSSGSGAGGRQGLALFNKAIRNHLDDVFQKNITIQNDVAFFNVKEIRKALGIGSPNGAKFSAFKEMVSGSGVSPERVETFLKLAEAAFAEGIPNASQFLVRRGILGGLGSVVGGATAGFAGGGGLAALTGGGATGAAALVGLVVMLRRTGRMLSSRTALNAAIDAINPKLAPRRQVEALRRMAVILPGIFFIDNAASTAAEAGFSAADRELQKRRVVVVQPEDVISGPHMPRPKIGVAIPVLHHEWLRVSAVAPLHPRHANAENGF